MELPLKENFCMCFSQFATYAPRPEKEYKVVRPNGAPVTQAEQDPNLYGAIPTPPEWRVEVTEDELEGVHDHEHDHGSNGNGQTAAPVAPAATVYAEAPQNSAAPKVSAVAAPQNGTAQIAAVTTQTVEAVVVELANGTKLLICPL